MRQSATQLREPIITIDDIKDQLNLLVHEIRSFSARIDEMSSSPLGLKYGFDCTYDYFFRIRDLKSKTKGIKTPNKPVILLVLMILECLKTGPRSERDIKDFVTEKCRKCGIKATNRGTIAGANLEISSACNILGAMGILEQAHVDDRVEPELFISAALPDPPSEESKVEDYLSLLAHRWSKIIESVVTESQTMEIASSTSINQEKSVTKSEQANNPHPHPHPNLHSNPPTASHNPRATTNNTTTTGPELSVAATTQTYPMDSSHAPMQDDMDFVDILMQSTEHLEQLDEHHSNHHTLNHLPSTQLQTQPNPSNADLTIFQNQKEPDKIHIQMQMHSSSSHASLPQQLIPTIASNYSSLPSEPKKTDDLSGTSVGFTSAQSQSKNQNPSDFSEAAYALNPSQDLAKSLLLTAGKPAGMTRKSASSTKIWKIKKLLVRNRLVRRGSSGSDQGETVGDDEVTRFLFTPEAFLEKWGENAFHHHASLEVEEKLLRRLASQCSLGFRSKEVTLVPSHVGTRYLDSHYDISASEIVPTICLVQPPPSAAAPSSSSKTSKAAPKTKSGTRNSQKQTTVLANTTQQASEGEQLDKFSTSVDHLRNGSGNALGDQSLLSSHPSSDSLDAMYIEHNDHANNSANNSNTASTAPRELDFSANITAQMLIDKVKKSKRHRGSSLLNHFTYNASSSSLSHLSSSSGVHHLTSAALTNLKNICQASIQGYWGQSQSHGEGREANSSHRRSTVNKQGNGSSATSLALNNTSALSDSLSEEKDKSSTGAVPVAEYVRTCQQQNIQLTNQYLNSSHFHASQILLNGALPVINTNLFKRYVPPLSILDYEKISLSTKSGSSGSGGPICYPDIMITTLEIPWRSIVSEFQIVRSEEMGLSFIPADQPLGVSSSSADLASEVYRSQSYSDIKTTSSNHQAAPNSSSSTQPHHSTTTAATTPSSSSTSKSSKLKPPDRIHRAASFDSSTVSLPHPHGNHIVSNSSSHTQTATTASISSTIFRCRSVSEVVAPAFREIDLLAPSISPLPSKETNNQSTYDVGIPIDRSVSRDLDLSPDNTLRSIKEEEQTQTAMEVDDESEEGEDSGDEDTSDEAYLSKHDEVLRTMREKWALMQQLKMETRREMMIQGQGSGGSGHGHGLASNKRSFSFQSPYKLQKLSHSHSNDNFAHSNANASTVSSSSPNEAEGTTEKDRGSEGTGNLNAQSEGSPLDGTTSLLGGLISYNSRKRSYSLLNISKIGEVASQLVHGGTSSAGSSTTVLDSNGSLPLAAVKKRGRPPKIQKTSHLHYGKINS